MVHSVAPPAPSLPFTLKHRVGHWMLRRVMRALFRPIVLGRHRVPRTPYILATNHLNWADPFLLLSEITPPPRLFFLGWEENVLRHWWERLIVGLGDFIPVSRERPADPTVLRTCLEVLARGGAVGIMPEGDVSTVEGQLLPLKRGVAYLSIASGCPIVPVSLTGARDLYLRKPIAIVIGEPIPPPPPLPGESRRAREERLLAQLEAALRAGLLPYREPPGPKRWRFLSTLFES